MNHARNGGTADRLVEQTQQRKKEQAWKTLRSTYIPWPRMKTRLAKGGRSLGRSGIWKSLTLSRHGAACSFPMPDRRPTKLKHRTSAGERDRSILLAVCSAMHVGVQCNRTQTRKMMKEGGLNRFGSVVLWL